MALRDLLFSIVAKDKTGAAFNSVNKKLRTTEGQAASASERIDRVGKRLAAAGAAGSVASAGILAAFRGSIQLHDTQARAEAKVAQAIEATGQARKFDVEQMKEQASALQAITRYGDEDILSNVTARYVGFGNITGDVLSRAQKLTLDLAAANDKGLAPSAQKLGASLADPAAGLSRLRREGVAFTDAQEEVIKGMVAAGNVAGAQALILDQVEKSVGGQAKAAREAGAGIIAAWSNTWGDVKEIVGGVLLDGLRVVVPVLEKMANAFQDMSPRGQRAAVIMGALAVAIPPVTAAIGAMAIGLAAVSGPIGALILGVSAATAAAVAFWPEIKATVGWIGDKLSAAADIGRGALSGFVGVVKGAAAWIGDKLSAALGTLGEAFGALPQPVRDVIRILGVVINPLSVLIGGVDETKAAFTRVFGALPEIVAASAKAVSDWITGKFNAAMQSLGDKVEWVEGKFAWLYDRVVGNSWVPDLIDEVGGEFGRLGGEMVDPTDAAADRVDGTFAGLVGRVGDKLSWLAQDGALTWDSFLGGLHEAGQEWAGRIVSDVFGQIADGAANAWPKLGLGAANSGASPGGGIMSSLIGGVGSWAKGLLGFDTGGAFSVAGGRAGVDRNIASVRLSEGERVKVERRGQPANDGRPVNVYIQTPDPQAFRASRAQVGAQIQRAVAAGNRAS